MKNDELEVLAKKIRDRILLDQAQVPPHEIGRALQREPSAESLGADGEFKALIDHQLLFTEYGYGAWTELKNPHVAEGVWRVLEKRDQWQPQ